MEEEKEFDDLYWASFIMDVLGVIIITYGLISTNTSFLIFGAKIIFYNIISSWVIDLYYFIKNRKK